MRYELLSLRGMKRSEMTKQSQANLEKPVFQKFYLDVLGLLRLANARLAKTATL